MTLSELAGKFLEAENADFLEGADPTLVTVAMEVRDLAFQLGDGSWDHAGYWMVLDMVRRSVDGAWGPGTLDVVGDPLLRMHASEDRGPHLGNLAGRLARGWRLFDPGDRTTLRERADEAGRTPEEEKVHLAHLGLLEALADVDRPQAIRVGSSWITDPETGQKAAITPARSLSWITLSAAWYPARARGAATAALRDEAWPDTPAADDPLEIAATLDDTILLHSLAPDPLTDLLLREKQEAIRAYVDIAPLTDGERALWDAYRETGAWTEAGALLGLTPGQLYTRKSRLFTKLRRPESDRL